MNYPFPPAPPCPPTPGLEAGIEQLRETIEIQARTIRYLLTNYDMLLRKVERESGDSGETVLWSTAPIVTIAQNAKIPAGWWIPLAVSNINFSNFQGSFQTVTAVPALFPFFSDGTATPNTAIDAVNITTKIGMPPTP